jgi:SDR family mycofactocin-dependent oxidoreductase
VTGRVAGKVALVTGAAHGQGRSHAIRLAEEGADVVVVDACAPMLPVPYPMGTAHELAETAAAVRALGRRALACQADVRAPAELSAAVDACLAEFGRLDIVAANAGVITYAMGWEITDEEWDTVVGVNLRGVFNTLRATAPTMIEAGRGGSIVITGSTAALVGLTHMAHYTASKWGVVGLAKSFANELAPFGIRVNSVHPTGVGADLSGRGADSFMGTVGGGQLPSLYKRYPAYAGAPGVNMLRDPALAAGEPFGRLPMVEPRDISEAVLWLASDESRYVTGIELPVDAGCTNRT